MKDHLIVKGIKFILEGLEVDTKDRNYVKTPWRVLEFYKEMFTNKPKSFPAVFKDDYSGMVLMRNHLTWTVCPHHLLPVRLKVHIAYIPAGGVVGVSKLARIVEAELTEPVMQETLTTKVADALMNNIQPTPIGAACIIAGEHLCMKMRGIRSAGDVITSAVRGVFLNKPAARDELMKLVGGMDGGAARDLPLQ